MSNTCCSRLVLYCLLLAICIPLFEGCAPRNAASLSFQAEEQAYIDLKLGFSIVVPFAWRRNRPPVSSAAYRPDQVSWTRSAKDNATSTLSVIALSVRDDTSPQEILSTFLNGSSELLTSQLTEGAADSAIETLRVDGCNHNARVIYQVFKKGGQAFVLAIETAGKTEENDKQLEKIISSFNIL